MIAKRIPIKSIKKSNFTGLVDYLVNRQGKTARVGKVTVTNCHSDDPHWAAMEATATQAQNTRAATDKTYHLLVSFRSGETPSPEILKAIEDRVCRGLGYEEHQRVSVVHHDTDNLHVHIAINKIHPVRHTILEPYYDHKKLGELCARLELEYGLERDNHTPKKTAGQVKAADMENAAGVESLIGWIRRECLPQIEAAKSWSELHGIMSENGLELRKRGNGLVMTDRSGTVVKASSVSRKCSKDALEARLGAFQPPAERQAHEQPKRCYEKKPVRSRVDTTELYAEYQAELRRNMQARADAWKTARERKNRLIEAAKRSGRLKRAAIKLTKGGLGKRVLYGLVSKELKTEIKKINQEYQAERQAVYDRYKRRVWNDWLKLKAEQGNKEALEVLRARQARFRLKGDTVSSKSPPKHQGMPPGAVVDSVTKKGTVIYRLEDAVVRDDGELLHVAKGASREGLEAVLRMAMHRYGENITVNGSADFKEQVAIAAAAARLDIHFDDPELEKRRTAIMAGKELSHASADKYIDERNQKRTRIFDIPEHKRFNALHAGEVSFAGVRQVDGQALALLRKDDLILVLPVDGAIARRLQRVKVGDSVSVTAGGVIQVKGRSRK